MYPNRKNKDALFDYVLLGVLLAITLISFLPLMHMVAVSFSDKTAVAGGRVTLIPINPTLAAYEAVMSDNAFFTAFGVSIQRVLIGVSINFVITAITAFALSRSSREFRGRNIYIWLLVFTMMFSTGLIPWYLNIRNLGLLDTIWALVLPGAVPVFNVILLMNYFRNLPKEIDEAAMIDGAAPLRMLTAIYLPMSLPALATVTLFSIVNHWNAFFDGLILMNRQVNYPLQTYLNQIVIQFNVANAHMTQEEINRLLKLSDKTVSASKILVGMIPILIVYPFLQKYFVTGITLGSIKE